MYGPGLLLADATINLILGGLLLLFPERIVAFLGLPSPQTGFYRSILGAVLVGIGVALLIEWRRSRDGLTGLGWLARSPSTCVVGLHSWPGWFAVWPT